MINQLLAEFHGLTPRSLVMWERPKATGLVVGSIATFLLIFGLLEYTIVTFACRVLQLSMIGFGILLKLDTPNFTADDAIEKVSSKIDIAKPYLVKLIAALVRTVMWEDASVSTRVLGVSIAVAMVGNLFSGLTLLFLITLIVFGGPTFYVQNKEKIDAIAGDAKKQMEGVATGLHMNKQKTE